MEFLIPGLILVALMAYASTRIKKRAAAAFDAESIDTDEYSLLKPKGFLHVIGDREHEFRAYSKDFGNGENAKHRQATIELDTFRNSDMDEIVREIETASETSETTVAGEKIRRVETTEISNRTEFSCVYKLVNADPAILRLRFAVLAEHCEDYSAIIDETLNNFGVK